MIDLRQELPRLFQGRVAVVGIGNPDLGDDGVGVALAEALRAGGCQDVLVGGTTPERWVEPIARRGYDTVLFLDAVDVGAEPGAAVLLGSAELVGRFPQLSTHKISLGTLARLLEAHPPTRVFLLGIQPESLRPRPGLTPTVQTTLTLLCDMLCDLLPNRTAALLACGERS